MKTFLAIILAVIAVTTASAEPVTITFKSGGSMTGPLVAKSDWEIKIETDYGIIPLQISAVTQESWTNAQSAKLSKPSGKYIQPQVTTTRKLEGGEKVEKQDASISASVIEAAYAANPVAADLKYIDKPIAVRGVINNIGTSEWGRPFVRIGNKVIKYYPWGSEKTVANLKVGQMTTLTGTCYGVTPPAEGSRIVIRE